MPPSRDGGYAASVRTTTRRFGRARAEWVTTALPAVASSTGYVAGGHAYLSRGVVGDLLGFAVLAGAAAVTGRRVRHEALLCLTLIGGVLAVGPEWPLRVREAAWWALFTAGLGGYLVVRRRVCD